MLPTFFVLGALNEYGDEELGLIHTIGFVIYWPIIFVIVAGMFVVEVLKDKFFKSKESK